MRPYDVGHDGTTVNFSNPDLRYMATEDTGWRPKGGLDEYKGHKVWEYESGPHEENRRESEGEVEIDDAVDDE